MKTVYFSVLLLFCTLIFSNFANPLIEMHDKIGLYVIHYESQVPKSHDGQIFGYGTAIVPIPKKILLLCTGLVSLLTIRKIIIN